MTEKELNDVSKQIQIVDEKIAFLHRKSMIQGSVDAYIRMIEKAVSALEDLQELCEIIRDRKQEQ